MLEIRNSGKEADLPVRSFGSSHIIPKTPHADLVVTGIKGATAPQQLVQEASEIFLRSLIEKLSFTAIFVPKYYVPTVLVFP